MRSYVVVAYYTTKTFYAELSEKLLKTLKQFSILHDVVGIENRGSWIKNTAYKPTFIKSMLLKHHSKNIVYVDCDAEFLKYPELFDTFGGNVGVYVFDRSCYRKSKQGTEVLSGTIFFKNCLKTLSIVERWIDCQRANPKMWDQRTLEKVLNGDFELLPGEYCKIFDRMPDIVDPVIVHYQASRRVRGRASSLPYA